ncbi:hypothetical protein GQ55_8G046700 [Panicum hallii var. hallii]|uniref:Uncharacterized protein n=1 Tax=Panicum hallii var. hallii TaxID=1504633 RepID=A0A2T7CKR8_9POAL|nr:hypothetical protein GQ55_8G046700 [Panicum hallii var. hallii]
MLAFLTFYCQFVSYGNPKFPTQLSSALQTFRSNSANSLEELRISPNSNPRSTNCSGKSPSQLSHSTATPNNNKVHRPKNHSSTSGRRRRRRRRLRLDVDGVLHDGLPGGGAGVDGVRLHVPARHPELAGAAHDAHLADVGQHLVPAHHRQAAALVLPAGEHEVHQHQEPERLLVRERVRALRAPDLRARGARGTRGQRVVDGHHRAEEGGGGVGRRRLRDADRRRARPAHDVVEVELERCEPGGVVRRGGRRCQRAQEEEEELAAAAGHGGGGVGARAASGGGRDEAAS